MLKRNFYPNCTKSTPLSWAAGHKRVVTGWVTVKIIWISSQNLFVIPMLYYFDKYARHAPIISVTRTGISNIIVREELQDEYELPGKIF